MRSNIVETATGAVVIAIAVVFFVYAYQTSGAATGSGGIVVKANFAQVSGLTTGADVRLSGIKVGSVVDQSLNPETYEAVVSLAISDEYNLPSDTIAKIASEGLLGGSYVALEPGGSETALANGDTIEYTQGAVDIMSLIGRAVFGSDNN